MLTIRKSGERGHAQHGWLESFHTFSFAGYHDRDHMGFRALRVINEDFVQPARGFGAHPHSDMEILTYVLEGALEHKDSMGNGSTIKPGEVQYMSAGTGVMHSEANASKKELVHLLQIWILPDVEGQEPRYDQKSFASALRPGNIALVASPDGARGSIAIRTDAELSLGALDAKHPLEHALDPKRHAWLQVTRGALSVNGLALEAGDGAAIDGESKLSMRTASTAELLLFDLA
jgi:redox-sensitive bicupin YhaK (pirin superfamily)